MRIGIVISIVIVSLSIALALSLIGSLAPRGTLATSRVLLARQELPYDLPTIFEPTDPHGDASQLYQQAFRYYESHARELRRGGSATADHLVDLLIRAMHAGRIVFGFLDEKLPTLPVAHRRFRQTLEGCVFEVLDRANQWYKQGRKKQPLQAVRALWALGQRALQRNVRFYNRLAGVTIMMEAAGVAFDWQSNGTPLNPTFHEATLKWSGHLDRIRRNWQAKFELLMQVEPHIGDTLRIARFDQDPSIRMAAILNLGYIKYNSKTTANKKAIRSVLEEAMHAGDPLIVKAAQAARSFPRDKVRTLY